MSEKVEETARPSEGVPFTETPEFKAAVASAAAEAAAAAVAGLVAKLEDGRKAHGTAPEGSDKSFIGALALELAELSGQGQGRKYVAPEILRQRALAREKMIQLIIDAKANGQVATYELRNKVLLDNQLIEPMWIDSTHITRQTQIDYAGIPNEVMIPVSETAKAIHAAFLESLGSVEKVVSESLGITPGGVVVRNGAVNATAARRSTGAEQQTESESGLRIHHTSQPGRYVEKHILGTIAEPARQSA